MVESEQVQDRRVTVVDVDFSLNGFVAVVVRFAVRESAFGEEKGDGGRERGRSSKEEQ